MKKNIAFRQPAEWKRHRACWLAWPSAADLWEENLEPAQAEFTALCLAIADPDPATGVPRGEQLEILVPDERAKKVAERALAAARPRFHVIPFGDIWVRDTGPIFVQDAAGKVGMSRFRFNGWGGKYVLTHDDQVGSKIALARTRETDLPVFEFNWILEGGSIDVDGEGTCLTTKQCLLNPNRNPGLSQQAIEEALAQSLGITRVLWLGDGLINDHTDGHIDTIARFAAPGVVLCMRAKSASDPNAEIMARIASDLRAFTDAQGRKLKIVEVPSPGEILSSEGDLMPASYMNFYIANTTVVVPTYRSPYDAEAVATIAECFPRYRTIGSPARSILSGGGAFHCITQQEPRE